MAPGSHGGALAIAPHREVQRGHRLLVGVEFLRSQKAALGCAGVAGLHGLGETVDSWQYLTGMVFGRPSRAYDRVVERRRAVALARHYREVEGLSVAQIADRLGRSPATVKAYF
jgi:hypothetical protein